MRILPAAALLAAQIGSSATPAFAADLVAETQRGEIRTGTFAGARLRIPLGDGQRERVRAGVTLAPTVHAREDGAPRLRIGEGLEYGLTGRRGPGLSLAGHRFSDLQRSPDGRRQNVSTVGWVAIGVGVVVVVGVGAFGWLVHEVNKNDD